MKLNSSLPSTESSLTSSSGVETGGSSTDVEKPIGARCPDLNALGQQLARVCERFGSLASSEESLGEGKEGNLDQGGKVVQSFIELWRDMLELRHSQATYREVHNQVRVIFANQCFIMSLGFPYLLE